MRPECTQAASGRDWPEDEIAPTREELAIVRGLREGRLTVVEPIEVSPAWAKALPWDRRRGDLLLEISHVLTEPTCPTAFLKWETSGEVIFRADADTVEAAVASA